MPRQHLLFTALLAAVCVTTGLGQTPLGTGFTYQGQLKQNGQPFNGSANLVFKLFDAASGGNLLGTQTASGVNVSAGLFTVLINGGGEFGTSAFDGQSRWLEVTANGTVLTPRQALTATPYATFASKPWAVSGNNVFYTGGDVGVGTTSPSATLHVNGNVGVGVANIPVGLTSELNGGNTPILNLDVNFRHPNLNTNFVGGAIRIDSRDDTADPLFQFLVRPAGANPETTIAAFTGAGDCGIGTVAPRARLEVDSFNETALRLHSTLNAVAPNVAFTRAGASRLGNIYWSDQFFLSNAITAASAVLQDNGSWTTSSDRRLKTNIAPAEGLLEKALALRPAQFCMNYEDPVTTPRKQLGLIAQDVQPVLPELVYGTDMLSLDYARIGVVAIGAIQEQQALITEQKVSISRQKQMIAAQQERIGKLESQTADLIARLEKLEASGADKGVVHGN